MAKSQRRVVMDKLSSSDTRDDAETRTILQCYEKGVVIFLTSKLITCFIDGFTSKMKSLLVYSM